MTKKDYQAVAAILYRARLRGAQEYTDRGGQLSTAYAQGVKVVGEELARLFAQENPRFDAERFREAVETGKCKGMRQA